MTNKRKRIASRAQGFDVVEGGFVEPREPRPKKLPPQNDQRNEWNKEHLPPHDMPVGKYEIWIAATDLDGHKDAKQSVCAWKIRPEGAIDDAQDRDEVWPGRLKHSSEKKAFVAGVAGALDRLPKGCRVTICCGEKYIVEGVNEDADRWQANGEFKIKPPGLYPSRQYGLVWRHVLESRDRISSVRNHITARFPEPRDLKILEALKEVARDRRGKDS